ncbi:MAG: response regulator transcription factor [Flavobacterium sp.]|nr:response regulator transcription factor [Flavobacterium sp.]
MKIKCLVVDDEPLAVKLIENYITQINNLELVATSNTALKAFEIMNQMRVDLLFLDIKMPGMTGIDFLKNIKNPPKTIFTTAYRDFALDGFELGVVDYLLKPVTFERFFKAVDKYLNENLVLQNTISEQIKEQFLFVKSGIKNHFISKNDILYFESDKDYVKIVLIDNSKIITKKKISDFELELESNSFLRIHRSFIINTSKVNAFTMNDIEVNSIEIPIGASYKNMVTNYLQNFKK